MLDIKRMEKIIGRIVARVVAEDTAQWITVHPGGKGKKSEGSGMKGGTHALIDKESGKILGGMGGKHNGEKISEVKKSFTGPRTPKNYTPPKNNPASKTSKGKSDSKNTSLSARSALASKNIDGETKSKVILDEWKKKFASMNDGSSSTEGAMPDPKDYVGRTRDYMDAMTRWMSGSTTSFSDDFVTRMKNAYIKGGDVCDDSGTIGTIVEKDGKPYLYQERKTKDSTVLYGSSSVERYVIDMETGKKISIRQDDYHSEGALEENGYKRLSHQRQTSTGVTYTDEPKDSDVIFSKSKLALLKDGIDRRVRAERRFYNNGDEYHVVQTKHGDIYLENEREAKEYKRLLNGDSGQSKKEEHRAGTSTTKKNTKQDSVTRSEAILKEWGKKVSRVPGSLGEKIADATIENGVLYEKNGTKLGTLVEKDGKQYLYSEKHKASYTAGLPVSEKYIIDVETGKREKISDGSSNDDALAERGYKKVVNAVQLRGGKSYVDEPEDSDIIFSPSKKKVLTEAIRNGTAVTNAGGVFSYVPTKNGSVQLRSQREIDEYNRLVQEHKEKQSRVKGGTNA